MKTIKVVCVLLILTFCTCVGLYISGRQGAFETNNWTENLTFQDADVIEFVSKSDNVKVMQITDLHLSFIYSALNTKTFNFIGKALDTENPDLLVVTGDLTIGLDNKNMLKKFAEFMESREQYWLYTLGNHDYEFGVGAYNLLSVLDGCQYCLFDVGYTNIGYGNNFVVLKNNMGQALYTLTLLDTSAYTVTKEQTNWYKWGMAGLRQKYEVNNFIFTHIPLPILSSLDLDVEERISPLKGDGGLWQAITDIGVSNYYAFGHDHLNNYSVNLNGVEFINCRSTGFSGYGRKDLARELIIYDFHYNSIDISRKNYYHYD